jgi:hypothetical protein
MLKLVLYRCALAEINYACDYRNMLGIHARLIRMLSDDDLDATL